MATTSATVDTVDLTCVCFRQSNDEFEGEGLDPNKGKQAFEPNEEENTKHTKKRLFVGSLSSITIIQL